MIDLKNFNGFFLIAGPCVLEDYEKAREIALRLADMCNRLAIPYIFKGSYDKANRSRLDSYRGPGIDKGLEILHRLKDDVETVMSDVHDVDEVLKAAEVLDIMQIPAFLCRQTDLLVEIAMEGRTINIKKGQFLAPWDMANVVEKIVKSGNEKIFLTERGTCFGYNNLVVDFRSLAIMKDLGFPVVFDATHSVQLPGRGGQVEYVPMLARAAMGAGVDGIFLEVYPEPSEALCDGANSLRLDLVEGLLEELKIIHLWRSNGTNT